jgi:hypothetical protein
MAEQRFSFRRSDEDGGNPANIAASEASNQTQRDAGAAPKYDQIQREFTGILTQITSSALESVAPVWGHVDFFCSGKETHGRTDTRPGV